MEPEDAACEVHRLEHGLGEEVLYRLEVLVDFALSSEAWIKRLKHRINHNMNKSRRISGFKIGETLGHGGKKQEKQQ
jgi:hypothetical protein